jgi:DNA polymerase V
MYALVDCNTFYASCEAIFNPALRDKPIVVLSNNDGCVISRNAEAKALNIPDLRPYFQVKELLRRQRVHVFSSNYELYGDISARVMALLESYSIGMEVYSIDEAFLQVRAEDYSQHGKAIKDMLWQQVRMPVCVGIAPTKTLAKLANRAAKKMPRLNGVCVLDAPHKWRWLLERFKPEDIWGIGRRIAARLEYLGIHTALQLIESNPKYLRRNFSVNLERTIRELRGEACLDLETEPAPRKEIICTRSFSYKVTELHELQQAISLYADRACEKLRKQKSLTATLWVYLESFDKKAGYFRHQRISTLPCLTNDTRHIAAEAARLILQLYRPGIRYKKCGIGLLDLRSRHYEQRDFFNPHQSDKSRRLMQLMDHVNGRYGKQKIKLLNAGIQPKWEMKRDYISPRYTTRWQDIPVVKCV